MIALDTNIIVRVVTADDPKQLKASTNLMSRERLWLCKTVLLETEWVLRFSYNLSRDAIFEAFRRILGLRNLEVEDRAAVLLALTLYGEGMDFADALHLASSRSADRFATFDRTLSKTAARLETNPPVSLLT
jgi:predicted nucleic-acid-binding protein